MCERCTILREQTIPTLLEALTTSDDDTISFIGRLLACAPIGREPEPYEVQAASERINEILLDAFEHQRRDAIKLTAWLILRLTAMKNRLITEADNEGDRGALSLEWDEDRQAFIIRGRAPAGHTVEHIVEIKPGETHAQAAYRAAHEFFEAFNVDNPHEF